MQQTLFCYRAWTIDANGNMVGYGVEEEFFATPNTATKKAWGRAAEALEVDSNQSIRMEYVRPKTTEQTQ